MKAPRRKRRAHGVPEIKGPLRHLRTCTTCGGAGYTSTTSQDADPKCYVCDGAGELLVDLTSQTAASKAATEIVRDHQARGRAGRNM